MHSLIRWLREREALSVERLAELAGLPPEVVRRAELVEPTATVRAAIAFCFGLWPEELEGHGSVRLHALIALDALASRDGLATGSFRRLGDRIGVDNVYMVQDVLLGLRRAGWLADEPFDRNILFDSFTVRPVRTRSRPN